MMNKVAQYYRELVSSLSERLRHGERDIDALVTQAREKIVRAGDLTQSEIESVIAAVKRDLEEFARSYEESHEDESDSVFMRVIKESLWQELADITDKTQLEWREGSESSRRVPQRRSGRSGQPGLREVPLSPGGIHPGRAAALSKMWPRSVPASALRALSVRKTMREASRIVVCLISPC